MFYVYTANCQFVQFQIVHAHLVHSIPKPDTNTKFTNCAVQFQNCTDWQIVHNIYTFSLKKINFWHVWTVYQPLNLCTTVRQYIFLLVCRLYSIFKWTKFLQKTCRMQLVRYLVGKILSRIFVTLWHRDEDHIVEKPGAVITANYTSVTIISEKKQNVNILWDINFFNPHTLKSQFAKEIRASVYFI